MILTMDRGSKKKGSVTKLILSKEKTVVLTGLPEKVEFKSKDIKIPVSVNIINSKGFNVAANIRLIIEKGDAIFANTMAKDIVIRVDPVYDKNVIISVLIQGIGIIKIKSEEVI